MCVYVRTRMCACTRVTRGTSETDTVIVRWARGPMPGPPPAALWSCLLTPVILHLPPCW